MEYRETALQLWKMSRQEEVRQIVLITWGVQAVIWAASVFLLGASPGMAALKTIGTWLGIMIASFLFAALLAVPGWIIRKTYDVKPLFVAWILVCHLIALSDKILVPLGFGVKLGFPFHALAFALALAANFILLLILLMTTFPHRWASGLFKVAFALGMISSVALAKKYVFPSRTLFLAEVFEGHENHLVQLVGGRAVSSAQISYELRLFDSEVRHGHKPPQ